MLIAAAAHVTSLTPRPNHGAVRAPQARAVGAEAAVCQESERLIRDVMMLRGVDSVLLFYPVAERLWKVDATRRKQSVQRRSAGFEGQIEVSVSAVTEYFTGLAINGRFGVD